MKETLSQENRRDIVRYRLERAEDSINEAKYTYDASMYNLATNRLRHSTDYEDFINSDAATVALYMPRVENFVQSIRDKINQSDPEYLLK